MNRLPSPAIGIMICSGRYRKLIVFVSRSSPSHRSVVTYSLSSTVLFHATLFAGVPCVLSVTQFLHQVGAFLKFETPQQVVGVLTSLFIHQLGGVFLCQILLQIVIVFQRQFLYQSSPAHRSEVGRYKLFLFQFTQDKLLQCFLIRQSEHIG